MQHIVIAKNQVKRCNGNIHIQTKRFFAECVLPQADGKQYKTDAKQSY